MTTVDTLVESYLSRLQAAALRLPPDRREELLGEIREHIDGARAAGAAADEAAVRTLLDRLGEPEEIVASAVEDTEPYGGSGGPYATPYTGAPAPPPSTTLETAAVLMLTVGSLLPLVGWLVGFVLLWSSRRWRTSEKVLGTLVVPGGPGLLLYLGAVVPGRTCIGTVSGGTVQVAGPVPAGQDAPPLAPPTFTSTERCTGGLPLPGWVTALLLLVVLVAPVVVAVVLHRRARARAAEEPPREVLPGGSGWGGLEIATVLLIGLGSFVVPVVGTVAGLVCLFISPRWTTREKTIGALLAAVPALLAFALVVSAFALPFSGRW